MHHKLIALGNAGSDPELRFTPAGQAVCSFSLATNRQYTNGNGEKIKETVWFRISCWGKLAEIVNQYVKKGSKVYVEGRLTPDKSTGGPRIWNKSDGTPSASFEINAETVRFLYDKGQPKSHTTEDGITYENVDDLPPEDEIPF